MAATDTSVAASKKKKIVIKKLYDSNKKNCNRSKKKKLSNPWVQPDPTRPIWDGLGWTYVIGWVGLNFFLTHHGGLGQNIPSTRPNSMHAHT